VRRSVTTKAPPATPPIKTGAHALKLAAMQSAKNAFCMKRRVVSDCCDEKAIAFNSRVSKSKV